MSLARLQLAKRIRGNFTKPKFHSFAMSSQGASHIKANKICQDYSLHYDDNDFSVIIVADGHGGHDYIRSATGSRLACEVSLANIKEFLAHLDTKKLREKSDTYLRTLEASIISSWRQEIENHFNANSLTEEEKANISQKANEKLQRGDFAFAYGTTLLAVVVGIDFWFGVQIGDCRCVDVSSTKIFNAEHIPWNDKCFLNVTTSLCDSNALSEFRHYFSSEAPLAVFIGSDGIEDSYKSLDELKQFYELVLQSFVDEEFERAENELREYLPRFSAQGSGDDMSIAGILDIKWLAENAKTSQAIDKSNEAMN